jgi:hypothetical protein
MGDQRKMRFLDGSSPGVVEWHLNVSAGIIQNKVCSYSSHKSKIG